MLTKIKAIKLIEAIVLVVVVAAVLVGSPARVSASCPESQPLVNGKCCPVDQIQINTIVNGADGTSKTVAECVSTTACDASTSPNGGTVCLFKVYINPTINLLSALVGVVVVIAIIYGSVEYISSAGDPKRVASGKQHITNGLLGLLAFILLYAFLQFLIPGGILHSGI